MNDTISIDLAPLRLIVAAFALLAALGTAGCNTVAGAGEDLQRAGEAVEDTAEKAKKK